MAFEFKTESTMIFENREDLENVVAMMPWSEDDKEAFLRTGEHNETEEIDLDGTDESIHKFTMKEV